MLLFASAGCNKMGLKSIHFTNDHVNVSIGQIYVAELEVSPSDFDESLITWTSSDESIAEVLNGYVTGVSEGEAVITASFGKKSASLYVSVEKVNVTAFTVPSSIEVAPGYSNTFTVSGISPDFATAANLVFSPGQNDDLSISVSGNKVTVTASSSMKDGTTGTLLVSNASGSLEKSMTVKYVYRPVTSITLSSTSLSLEMGASAKLTATVSPSNATDAAITWTVSNTSVVSYDQSTSMLTTKGPGTATVTAKAGTKSASCSVTVTGLQIKGKSIMLSGDKYAQKLTLGSGVDAKWSVTDATVAKISEDGTLTGLKAGWVDVKAVYNGATSVLNVRVVSGDCTLECFTTRTATSYLDSYKSPVYKMSGSISSMYVLPSYGSENVYLATSDGYSLNFSEMTQLFGGNLTLTRTGDSMYDTFLLGPNNEFYNSYIGSSLTGSTQARFVTPDGRSTTFTWNKSLQSITMRSNVSAEAEQTQRVGGTFTVTHTGNYFFYANTGTVYHEYGTGNYGRSVQLYSTTKYTLVCDSAPDLFNDYYGMVTLKSSTPKGTYNFYVKEYPSVKFTFIYK